MAYNHKPFFSKISIQGKNLDELSYVFTSGPIEQKKCTMHVFGVFAISSAHEIYQQFIKQTVKHFLDFYHKLPELAPEATSNETIDHAEFAFENAIQYIYDKVTSSLITLQEEQKRPYPFDIKKIHCILGCLSDDTLFLSSTGTVLRAYYIYPNMKKQGLSRHCIAPIIDQQSLDDQPQRLFSNIISGSVGIPGGTVCITTVSLLDYVSLEQLKQRITTQLPKSFAPALEKILYKTNSRNDMTALCIYPTYDGNEESEYILDRRQTAANASMELLNTRQQGTDTVMRASKVFQLKKTYFAFAILMKSLVRALSSLEHWLFQPANRKKITKIYSTFLHICTVSTRVCMRSIHDWYSSIKDGEHKKFWYRRYSAASSSLIAMFARISKFVASRFNLVRMSLLKIPATSRFLLVFSILFIFLFLYSLVAINEHKRRQQNTTTVNNALETIRQKFAEAEASMIYQNETGTYAIYQEIQKRIESLPQQLSKNQNEQVNVLRQNMSDFEKKLNHIISVDTLDTLASFDANVFGDNAGFSEQNSAIVLYGTAAFSFLVQPYASVRAVPWPADIHPMRSVALASSQSLYVYDSNGSRVYRINGTSPPQAIPFSFGTSESQCDQLLFFNGSLYNYDSASGSIYKHARRGSGFSEGVDWVREKTIDLHDVSDIDIDGSVYVLKANGDLYQYSNGKPRHISFPSIITEKNAFSRIETDSLIPFLFLLNRTTNKIIVIDKKTFALKAQLTSDAFRNLADIQLVPKDKILLAFDGKTIYRIPLDVLKK